MNGPTVKQRAALDVLRRRGELRVSNHTDLDDGAVYWQQARALVSAGVAREVSVTRIIAVGGPYDGPADPCATASPAQAPSNQPAPSMTGGVAYSQGNDR